MFLVTQYHPLTLTGGRLNLEIISDGDRREQKVVGGGGEREREMIKELELMMMRDLGELS